MPNSGRHHHPEDRSFDPYREDRRDDYRGAPGEERSDRERDDWRREEWRRDTIDRGGTRGSIERYPAQRSPRYEDHGAGDEYDAPRQTHYGDRYPSQWSPASTTPEPRVRGPHVGKGPAGFKRSDERIFELVCEALTDDDHVDASQIEVTVNNAEVTLAGSVEDRRAKRLAEDCVERVPGVRDIQNQLRVGIDEKKHRLS